jgi:hypothetical protein
MRYFSANLRLRTTTHADTQQMQKEGHSAKRKVLPGIEPGLPEDTDDESESGVITAT